ncbi:MAG: glycosyltransferase family 2 protein [Geobacter sp.]
MNTPHTHIPSLSLITVCKNSDTTIGRTISSVETQKEDGVEYLIIDGGSTDTTLAVIEACPCIDLLVSEPDQGIADAFNKGIRRATGDIIALLNADDQLALGALSIVRTYFANHPEVDVIHGDVLLHENSRTIKRIKPAGRWWYPWRLVLFNHPATFVRKSVYEKHGLFDTSYRIAMDVELFFRWKSRGVTINYLPEVLVNVQAGGASGQQAVRGFQEVRRAALQYGFSPFLVQIQLGGKLFVWWLLERFAAIGRPKLPS